MNGENMSEIMRGIEPVEISFEDKLRDDPAFLVEMIEDPVKAFRAYGYNGDEKMMAMLQGMARNLRRHAIRVFAEVSNLPQASQGCDACNGCRACKACIAIQV